MDNTLNDIMTSTYIELTNEDSSITLMDFINGFEAFLNDLDEENNLE